MISFPKCRKKLEHCKKKKKKKKIFKQFWFVIKVEKEERNAIMVYTF